jgi:hypothetical protein
MWIGPVKFADRSEHTNGASNLVNILVQLSQGNCETTIVGTTACKLVRQETSTLSSINMVENASVVWEFLKGRKLPGVMAVDRVCLYYYSTPYLTVPYILEPFYFAYIILHHACLLLELSGLSHQSYVLNILACKLRIASTL